MKIYAVFFEHQDFPGTAELLCAMDAQLADNWWEGWEELQAKAAEDNGAVARSVMMTIELPDQPIKAALASPPLAIRGAVALMPGGDTNA